MTVLHAPELRPRRRAGAEGVQVGVTGAAADHFAPADVYLSPEMRARIDALRGAPVYVEGVDGPVDRSHER